MMTNQIPVIGRLMDFNNKTVFDFINEIYGNRSHLPEWTKEAVINIKSYGNSQMFSRHDKTLKDDVDVIKSFLSTSTFSEYMLVPGQFMRPDGIYIGMLSSHIYWTLLISAKMFTNELSDVEIGHDKNSTNWNLLYCQKDGKVKCTNLKKKLDNVCNNFNHCGSLRIHYILAQTQTSNTSNQSNRGGCYVEGNDIIMYVDETLLECYFPREYANLLKEILACN